MSDQSEFSWSLANARAEIQRADMHSPIFTRSSVKWRLFTQSRGSHIGFYIGSIEENKCSWTFTITVIHPTSSANICCTLSTRVIERLPNGTGFGEMIAGSKLNEYIHADGSMHINATIKRATVEEVESLLAAEVRNTEQEKRKREEVAKQLTAAASAEKRKREAVEMQLAAQVRNTEQEKRKREEVQKQLIAAGDNAKAEKIKREAVEKQLAAAVHNAEQEKRKREEEMAVSVKALADAESALKVFVSCPDSRFKQMIESISYDSAESALHLISLKNIPFSSLLSTTKSSSIGTVLSASVFEPLLKNEEELTRSLIVEGPFPSSQLSSLLSFFSSLVTTAPSPIVQQVALSASNSLATLIRDITLCAVTNIDDDIAEIIRSEVNSVFEKLRTHDMDKIVQENESEYVKHNERVALLSQDSVSARERGELARALEAEAELAIMLSRALSTNERIRHRIANPSDAEQCLFSAVGVVVDNNSSSSGSSLSLSSSSSSSSSASTLSSPLSTSASSSASLSLLTAIPGVVACSSKRTQLVDHIHCVEGDIETVKVLLVKVNDVDVEMREMWRVKGEQQEKETEQARVLYEEEADLTKKLAKLAEHKKQQRNGETFSAQSQQFFSEWSRMKVSVTQSLNTKLEHLNTATSVLTSGASCYTQSSVLIEDAYRNIGTMLAARLGEFRGRISAFEKDYCKSFCQLFTLLSMKKYRQEKRIKTQEKDCEYIHHQIGMATRDDNIRSVTRLKSDLEEARSDIDDSKSSHAATVKSLLDLDTAPARLLLSRHGFEHPDGTVNDLISGEEHTRAAAEFEFKYKQFEGTLEMDALAASQLQQIKKTVLQQRAK